MRISATQRRERSALYCRFDLRRPGRRGDSRPRPRESLPAADHGCVPTTGCPDREGIDAFGFDLTLEGAASWEGRPVMVVGASDPADTASAQFWTDAERLVLVRMRGDIKGIGGTDVHLQG